MVAVEDEKEEEEEEWSGGDGGGAKAVVIQGAAVIYFEEAARRFGSAECVASCENVVDPNHGGARPGGGATGRPRNMIEAAVYPPPPFDLCPATLPPRRISSSCWPTLNPCSA